MIRTWVAALATLPLLAAAAAAGPIPWSYTAHVRTETGTTVLKFGDGPLAYDPTGTGQDDTPTTRDFVFTTPLPEFDTSGAASGSAVVNLFHLPYGNTYTSPRIDTWFAEEAPPADDRFSVTLDLRDDATGDTGRIEYTGQLRAASSGTHPAYFLFSLDAAPGVTDLTLGGTRYRVTALESLPDEIDEPAAVRLRITADPGPINTPEPGTLLLAGMGVGIAGVGRRLRRAIT